MEETIAKIEVKWLEGPAPDSSGACEEKIKTAIGESARGTRYEDP